MAKLVVARLGPVEFSVPEGSFDELARDTSYRVDVPEPLEGLGSPVGRGVESDLMTIRGVVFPGFTGSQSSVQRLRDLAETGKSALLVDGAGRLYGHWMISRVSERKTMFMDPGVPRRIEYDLTLIADPDGELVPL